MLAIAVGVVTWLVLMIAVVQVARAARDEEPRELAAPAPEPDGNVVWLRDQTR